MTQEVRLRWCAALAKLVQPDHAEEAGAALAGMMPMFADLPDACFGRSTLDGVAMGKRRTIVPSYADIRTVMNAWVRDNRSDTLRLAGPESHLTDLERLWVKSWENRDKSNPAACRNLLSLIQDQSWSAYDVICAREGTVSQPKPDEGYSKDVADRLAAFYAEMRGHTSRSAEVSDYKPSSVSPAQLAEARRQSGILVPSR